LELRDRILEQAIFLFKTYGIRSVTMDDIAQRLAISKKTLYHHFKNKSNIVKESMLIILKEDKCCIEEITTNSRDEIEEVVKMNANMRQILREINPAMIYDVQKYYPEAWKLYDDFKNYIHERIVRNLKQGIQQGVFRPEIDPEILTIARLEQVQLAFDPIIFPPEKFNILNIQVQLFENFVRGLLTPKGLKLYKSYSQNYNLD